MATKYSSDEFLKTSLLKFFQKKENGDRIVPFMNKTSTISLRLLDHFCVSYSKSKPVVYTLDNEGKYFDAYSSYKNQLLQFGKRKFDPFKRNSRMIWTYNGKEYITTNAQLCFLKWCICCKVLEYVEKHKDEINEDMKTILVKNDKKRSSKRRSSRKSRGGESSNTATRVQVSDNDSVIINFE
jgi:hypothetical protein